MPYVAGCGGGAYENSRLIMQRKSKSNMCTNRNFKNQSASRTLSHSNSLANVIGQSTIPVLSANFTNSNSINNNNNSNNNNNTTTTSSNNNNNSSTGSNNSSNNLLNNNSYIAAVVATQQQQQQQQHQQQQSQSPASSGNLSPNNNQQQQQLQSSILQQRINAAAAAMVAQHQQQQHKMMLHNALTRAVSHPQNNSSNVVSLVHTLIENLGHRKLERTQSEPLPQVNTSRYKTELCRPFEEAGECKYGEKCQFAHGMHELRNLQRHPKYKTELCRTFHSVGFCPYGPRCHFVHNAEEARNHNRAVHAAYVRAAAAAGQPMPMSPPMSMSTGSDRASPTGSLSLSPTNSMASFFPDQTSPTSYSSQGFAFPQNNSPPASPIAQCSPVATPPPSQQQQQQQSSGTAVDDARLPIFNQLSSTMDAFKHLAM